MPKRARAEPAHALAERLLRRVDAGEVTHGCVARAERCELPVMLDRGEDRRRVVLHVVDDEGLAQVRRDDERRDARAWAPLVMRAGLATLTRRGDVIPLPAELVVRDDEHRVLLARAAPDRADQRDEVVLAVRRARVPRMLVLLAERLDEADRLELAALRTRRAGDLQELRLVLQPEATSRIRRVVREVHERLMVVLEHPVGALRILEGRVGIRVGTVRPRAVRPTWSVHVAGGIRPAAGVPGPVDSLARQALADRRVGLRNELRSERAERLGRRLHRVDREVAARAVRDG